jgi:nicotinate dehydrogenase subunit B
MQARPALAALANSAPPAAAAVANAVYDAVGIKSRDLPITPARLLSA